MDDERPRRSSLIRTCAAFVALGLSACGPSARLGSAESAIFGGTPAPDDTAVVAIINFAGGQCSGSLISAELVLTARHCVADTAGKELQVVCGQTTFKPPDSAGAIFVVPLPQISEDPKDYLAVSEIRMPEGLGDDLCGTDVVLLRLAQPLRNVPALSPRLEPPVVPNEAYSAVGFGIDESLADKPVGVRKRLDALAVACSGSACADADVRDNEWVGSGGPCSGDSGGPALDADSLIIGVVSRGKTGCVDPVFSDVVTRADWLKSEAIAAANAAREQPPSWAPCDAANPCTPPPEPKDDGPAATCTYSGARRVPGGPAWLLGLGLLAWPLRHRWKNRSGRRSKRL